MKCKNTTLPVIVHETSFVCLNLVDKEITFTSHQDTKQSTSKCFGVTMVISNLCSSISQFRVNCTAWNPKMGQNRNLVIFFTRKIGLNAVKLLNKKNCMSLEGLLFLKKSATGWRETVVSLLRQRMSKYITLAILSCTNLVLYVASIHCWSFVEGWSCVFGKIISLQFMRTLYSFDFDSTKRLEGKWTLVIVFDRMNVYRLLRTIIGNNL